MKTKVCVLGAGRMGSALVQTLLQAGHPVVVWKRADDAVVRAPAGEARNG